MDIKFLDVGDKDKPAILLFMGGGVGMESAYFIEIILKYKFRIITTISPGYHGCPISKDDNLYTTVDIAHDIMKFLNIEEYSVMGVSLGGIYALLYAKKYNIKSLALWSALSGPYI